MSFLELFYVLHFVCEPPFAPEYNIQTYFSQVCSICNLRGSCDRACIKPHEEESACMDDIMRVLLAYGLDALVGSVENELHTRETVIASVRKLLKEVVELSATPLDPNLSRPVPKQPLSRIKESPPLPTKRPGITDVEMKKGDWLCPR